MNWKYNPEISLGNILQVITILCGLFGAYMTLVNTDTRHDAELKASREQVAEIKMKQDQITKEVKEEIKEVKQGVNSINDKLTTVLIENARQNNRR